MRGEKDTLWNPMIGQCGYITQWISMQSQREIDKKNMQQCEKCDEVLFKESRVKKGTMIAAM